MPILFPIEPVSTVVGAFRALPYRVSAKSDFLSPAVMDIWDGCPMECVSAAETTPPQPIARPGCAPALQGTAGVGIPPQAAPGWTECRNRPHLFRKISA